VRRDGWSSLIISIPIGILIASIYYGRSHHEETRELPGERDNARNNARCTQARKAMQGLDGQHQDVDRTLRGRVNQNDREQGQMEKVRPWCGHWPTLGSRTAKEQNKIERVSNFIIYLCCLYFM